MSHVEEQKFFFFFKALLPTSMLKNLCENYEPSRDQLVSSVG